MKGNKLENSGFGLDQVWNCTKIEVQFANLWLGFPGSNFTWVASDNEQFNLTITTEGKLALYTKTASEEQNTKVEWASTNEEAATMAQLDVS